MAQTVSLRVYYEDTDAGGVVYHANYLKFAERARTECLRTLGFENSALAEKQGVLLVVRHIEADYKAPARLDDLLIVQTDIIDLGNASFTMQQDIKRNESLFVRIKVVIACVGTNGKIARIPMILRQKLEGLRV
jgi:acyl-CoA thioester hydrolase